MPSLGHSLMVKQEPFKLLIRVRFPVSSCFLPIREALNSAIRNKKPVAETIKVVIIS